MDVLSGRPMLMLTRKPLLTEAIIAVLSLYRTNVLTTISYDVNSR